MCLICISKDIQYMSTCLPRNIWIKKITYWRLTSLYYKYCTCQFMYVVKYMSNGQKFIKKKHANSERNNQAQLVNAGFLPTGSTGNRWFKEAQRYLSFAGTYGTMNWQLVTKWSWLFHAHCIFISTDTIPKWLTSVLLCFTDACTLPSLSIFQYGFLPHRCQKMTLKKGRKLWFNNTKARKNPNLIMAALLEKKLRSRLDFVSLCDLLLRHFPGIIVITFMVLDTKHIHCAHTKPKSGTIYLNLCLLSINLLGPHSLKV